VISADVLDDLDQLVEAVALLAGEVDEFRRSLDDGAAFGRAGDGDAAPAAELEQSLVAEQPQRTQDGVGVDAEDGGEILRRRESLAGLASPSAMARRISAATCSCRSRGSSRLSLT
jgi:hypothetical protein